MSSRAFQSILFLSLLAACRSAPARSTDLEDGDPRDAQARFGALPGTEPATATRDREAPAAEAVTLEHALASAMQRDPRLAVARARIRALRAREEQVRLSNPELVLRSETAPLEGSTFAEAEYLIGLSQTLPLGPRLSRAAESARLKTDQAAQEMRATVLLVRREVQGAFATALYAQEAARRRSNLLELALEHAAIARARLESGDVVQAEIVQAELALIEARQEEQRAAGLREQALLELAAAMGRPELPVTRVEGDLSESLDLPSLRQLAGSLAAHPALQAASLRSDAARARVELREAERIPDVRLDLLYRRLEATDTHAFDVGVALPLRLFNDGTALVEESRSELYAARAQERQTWQSLELGLRRTHQRLEQALARLAQIEGDVLPLLRSLGERAEARHDLGDLSYEELLPLRQSVLLQELGELEARRDVMAAWAELTPFLEGG